MKKTIYIAKKFDLNDVSYSQNIQEKTFETNVKEAIQNFNNVDNASTYLEPLKNIIIGIIC